MLQFIAFPVRHPEIIAILFNQRGLAENNRSASRREPAFKSHVLKVELFNAHIFCISENIYFDIRKEILQT